MADYATVLTGGSNSYQTTAEHLNYTATDFLSDGIVGVVSNTAGVAPMTGGLAVNAQGSPNMTVAVTTGVAYVTATPTGQASQRLRAKIAAQNATIAANATGGTRYDWIYVTISATNANTPNTAGDNVASITVSRSTSSTTDNGTAPTYGYHIATVTVANSASSITNGNIADTRATSSIAAVASSGWASGLATPNTVTYNGNRNYSVVFNSIDYTSTFSNGMRLRLTRAITAPTQCTSLASASSQYYSKSSPTGMTFTNNFVVSAWIKVTSYGIGVIASRWDGSSGWYMRVNASGVLELVGTNGGAANFSQVNSYASVPLNKWIHVSAQLDMATFTATPTTSYIMFDGVDTPAQVQRGGTNPTALVQAGNINIGAANALSFFNGKIAQVAIYSAKVTQATITASITQTLAGTETSLISAYSFNNSINDLNANANNLAANGSAVATNVDSPFAGGANASTAYTAGTTEFGEVFDVSFSTNTTVVVQVPDGYAIPTSGGVSAVAYSPHATPLGWPLNGGITQLSQVLVMTNQASITAQVDLSGLTSAVYVPKGRRLKVHAEGLFQSTATGTHNALYIIQGSTILQTSQIPATEVNTPLGGKIELTLFPSSGSNTYKLASASSGTGTLFAATTAPAIIAMELV